MEDRREEILKNTTDAYMVTDLYDRCLHSADPANQAPTNLDEPVKEPSAQETSATTRVGKTSTRKKWLNATIKKKEENKFPMKITSEKKKHRTTNERTLFQMGYQLGEAKLAALTIQKKRYCPTEERDWYTKSGSHQEND